MAEREINRIRARLGEGDVLKPFRRAVEGGDQFVVVTDGTDDGIASMFLLQLLGFSLRVLYLFSSERDDWRKSHQQRKVLNFHFVLQDQLDVSVCDDSKTEKFFRKFYGSDPVDTVNVMWLTKTHGLLQEALRYCPETIRRLRVYLPMNAKNLFFAAGRDDAGGTDLVKYFCQDPRGEVVLCQQDDVPPEYAVLVRKRASAHGEPPHNPERALNVMMQNLLRLCSPEMTVQQTHELGMLLAMHKRTPDMDKFEQSSSDYLRENYDKNCSNFRLFSTIAFMYQDTTLRTGYAVMDEYVSSGSLRRSVVIKQEEGGRHSEVVFQSAFLTKLLDLLPVLV